MTHPLLFCNILTLAGEKKQRILPAFVFLFLFYFLLVNSIIDMQYNTENEKVFVGNTSYSPLPNRSLLTHDPQVKRTRKILIVILGVCLVSN